MPSDGRIWLFPLITVLVLAALGVYHSGAGPDGNASPMTEQAKLEKAQ